MTGLLKLSGTRGRRDSTVDVRDATTKTVQTVRRANQPALSAVKNALIATISTFLSHYFNPQFLQSGWLSEYRPDLGTTSNPELVTRRVLEMKTRFLYCVREAARYLAAYGGSFHALAAFQDDKITETLEIISTSERRFNDHLLNRCTEVMATDISSVTLTDAICGQFLRRVLQMLRQDVRDEEHIKYLYFFCVWKMPEVLFDPFISSMVRRREVQALLANPRLPEDVISLLRDVRGRHVFGPPERNGTPVDEGWDLEPSGPKDHPQPRRGAWRRLFSRSKQKGSPTQPRQRERRRWDRSA